jgi:hypothetical protein
MSGGSFNYLCYKDGYDLLETSTEDDLCSMVNTIETYGIDDKAIVRHIKLMLNKMLAIRNMTDELTELSAKSAEVFRAVEWFESCDTSKESAIKAINDFSIKASFVS